MQWSKAHYIMNSKTLMKLKKKIKILRIKSSLQRYVLKDVNCWTVFDFLKGAGNAFHNVVTATEKDLSPKDVNIFPRGKSDGNPSFDRSW